MPSPTIHSKNTTKRLSQLMLPLLLLIGATSCEKVIDLDLNNAAKKVVIEANLSDQPNSCSVLLSMSKNFDEANAPVGISGAVVTISDNNNTPVALLETGAGQYVAPALKGIPGHTYQLRVTTNNETYTANCTMPQRVAFDSLYITDRTFFNNTRKYATAVYKDRAAEKNAYRFIQYVNGVKEKTLFVRDDDANNGLTVNRTLAYFYDDEEEKEKAINRGDNVRIEMLCISYPVYKYWNSLAESATGDNQSNTPGNPITNIQGGALGYFSAHTLQQKSIVVP